MEAMNLFGDCQMSLEVLYKHMPKKVVCSLVEKIFPNVVRHEMRFRQTMGDHDIDYEIGIGIAKVRYLREHNLELSSLNGEKPWREGIFAKVRSMYREDFEDIDLSDEEYEVLDNLDRTAQVYLPRCLRSIFEGWQFISKEQEDELEMVKADGMRLKDAKRQTHEMCLEAVKQNPFALQYVERPMPEYYEAALKGLEKSKFNVHWLK